MPIRIPLVLAGCTGVLVGLLLTSTPSSSRPVDTTHAAADTTKPIRSIMVGLAQNMDRISTGLWYEDYDLIRQGAQDIAQHPKVPQAQVAKIKSTLGRQFSTFARYDKMVHRTASTLVDAAEAKNWSGVVNAHEKLQRGCMSCHTAFRDQIRPVLAP